MNGKIMLNGKAYSSSGRPSREITMAQWLALPDTKYTDGIVYYIKDVGGANQFPPLIYSDEEREIGVWRDGKPLYQKTINIQNPSHDGNWHDIAHGISNPDIFANINGVAYWVVNADTIAHVPIPSRDETNSVNYGVLIRIVGSNLQYAITGYGSTTFSKMSITIQYTKTTDVAGSGTWTTDGTFAHHYSTDEKVVGTWIDGKPLYEKSYVTSQFSGGYDITTDIPFDGAFVVSGYYLLNDSNGSMIGLNEWFASANYSFCHVEKATKKIRCYLMGYTGIGYFTIRYTKTTD